MREHELRSLPGPHRGPGYHKLLEGEGFVVWDCVCHCGRDSPASESVFDAHRVAVVLGGSFHYESEFGGTLLGPGSMWLGRADGGYCYRHVDDGGDRSVIFDFSDELLDGVRRSLAIRGVDGVAFGSATLAASSSTAATTSLTLQARALRHIEVHHQQDCSLHVLTDQAGMSIFRFLRLFKSLTPQTARQQLIATRLRAAATRLIETNHQVLEIA